MAKIGLDIGHGRNTFPPSKGVYKNGIGYHEYDANSRVGRKLKAKLEAAGHTVVMAQPFNSNDVPLTTRTNRYFANGVDLIVSCHANASASSASGYASFYWHNDSKAKKLSDLYEQEIKRQGFKLWGGSRPSKPNDWSNFHMCRVPAQKGVPSILLENGFMTNAGDFEWIFGAKKDVYAEKCATAAFNAIQRYLGKGASSVAKPAKPKPSKPTTSASNLGLVDWMNKQKMNSSFANRKKLATKHGIKNYKGTASQNTQLLNKLKGTSAVNKTPNKPKAKLKIDGYWGIQLNKALQRYFGTVVDGEIWGQYSGNQAAKAITGGVKFGKGGSPVIKALQKHVGAKQDGILGKDTIIKLQQFLGMKYVDGIISKPSAMVKELQRRLNAGTF